MADVTPGDQQDAVTPDASQSDINQVDGQVDGGPIGVSPAELTEATPSAETISNETAGLKETASPDESVGLNETAVPSDPSAPSEAAAPGDTAAPAIAEPVGSAPEPPTTAAAAPAPSPAPVATAAAQPELESSTIVPPLGGEAAASEEGGEWDLLVGKVRDFLASGQLQALWNQARTPLTLVLALVGVLLVLRVYTGLLAALDSLPLIPGLLELVGVIWTVRVGLPKLVQKSQRQQLLAGLRERWQRFSGKG